MIKLLAVAFAVVLFQTASMAQASDVSFRINVGGPPVVISQPPAFLYPPELGFGVAVGVPYDMFYLSGIYYLYRGGNWYSTSTYGGDLRRLRHRELPRELRRHRMAGIREYRDREHRGYTRDGDHYRGRSFRPDGRGHGEHRDRNGRGHERREDRRERRHDERGDDRR
ncbi:MAG: hypothetical protein A2075_02215 [Geobacteraceae bacterium GWC2_58_44]|nr:MAG: hypothetical protein A2075_02215 [Geobacteraceae bacterium GWC2_58_44]